MCPDIIRREGFDPLQLKGIGKRMVKSLHTPLVDGYDLISLVEHLILLRRNTCFLLRIDMPERPGREREKRLAIDAKKAD